MSFEEHLTETFEQAGGYLPSPDLLGRVRRSIDQDLAHRRRVRYVAAGVVLAASVALGWLALFVSTGATGSPTVPRWVIEVWETALLAGVTAVMGPSIRRFGKTYIADVFRLDGSTGPRFLRLLDVAYYLVFAGIILMGVDGAALTEPALRAQLASQLQGAAERIAVLLAVMGVLHAVTIAVLPVVGLVFSSLVRRSRRAGAGDEAPPLSRKSEVADRLARFVVWATAALVVGAVLVVVGLLVAANIG